jgi:TRAP-type C4-dicarboxylate transport system permease small subunit
MNRVLRWVLGIAIAFIAAIVLLGVFAQSHNDPASPEDYADSGEGAGR